MTVTTTYAIVDRPIEKIVATCTERERYTLAVTTTHRHALSLGIRYDTVLSGVVRLSLDDAEDIAKGILTLVKQERTKR